MRKKILLFLTLIFILMPQFSFSQETEDNGTAIPEASEEKSVTEQKDEPASLFYIRWTLIEKYKDYTEALRQLLLYQEKNPDDFDSAYVLIKRIMDRRQNYYKNVQQIISHIETNPDDEEKIQSEIDRFSENLEKNPPEELAKMKSMLEQMYTFRIYASRFDEILAASSEQTLKGNYYETSSRGRNRREVEKGAFEIIEENLRTTDDSETPHPFQVYFDNFRTSGQNEIIDQTDSIILGIKKDLLEFENEDLQKNFDEITAAFISDLENQDYEKANEDFNQLSLVYWRYADIRNRLTGSANNLKQLFYRQKELDPELSDASYLPFMYRLILGTSAHEYSGIVGAVEHKWDLNVEKMKSLAASLVKQKGDDYFAKLPSDILEKDFDIQRFTDKNLYVSSIEKYADLSKNINNLYSMFRTYDENGFESQEAYEPYPEYAVSINYIENLTDKTIDLFNIVQKLKTEQKTENDIVAAFEKGEGSPDFDSSAYVPELFGCVTKMSGITGLKSELLVESYDWGKAYLNLSQTDGILENKQYYAFLDVEKLYNNYVNQIFNVSENAITSAWGIITKSYSKDADIFLNYLKEYEDYSIVYKNGLDNLLSQETLEKIDGKPGEILAYAKALGPQKDSQYYYSNLTIQMTSYIQNSADTYINSLETKKSTLTDNLNAHPDWLELQEITSVVNQTVSYLDERENQIKDLKDRSIATTKEMRSQIARAQVAKEEADDLFTQAQNAYSRNQYDEAAELLESASEKYVDSLSIVEDNNLRLDSDKRKLELSQKIVNAKNEIVIRQARDYYSKAREAMNYERYDDAESYITSAINKWAETHTEKDPEFEAFKVLVNTAVSMKTGSELLPSDPLYTEMSQLLNIASQYYEEGASYMKAGEKEKALESLEKADSNVDKLKQVYPTNQAASLLKLKIEQLRDPVKFEQEFSQKINTAINKCNNPETQMEGYNQLLSYYNLDPTYKGLKDKIYNLEIKLGMRQKPVDNSAAARAKRTTDEAEKLFKNAGNNQTKLNNALNKVNEALNINPNYTRAENLKVSIISKIGASAVITLTAEDENTYNKAQRAYSAGNYEDANMYMNQLLEKNKGYTSVKKVAELKNKIDTRM